MRIALVSDIHGNAAALEAVVADVEAHGVDRVICLGDVAAAGPQPAECVRLLRSLGYPVVRGNTDDLLLHPPDPGDAPDEAARRRFETLSWGAAQLSPDDRDFLGRFEPTIEVDLAAGATLLCYHGSPRSYDDILLPTTPDAEVERLMTGVEAAILAGGHTHVSMVRPNGKRLIVNPGSVGMTFFRVGGSITADPPWAEYGLLTWEAGLASVELRRVPLDRESLIGAARESGMPNAEGWISGWG
jgi:predicted phosphodiesterase